MQGKVLLIDEVHPMIPGELSAMGFSCDSFPGYRRDDYRKIIGEYDGIIIRSGITLDREILSCASRLKFIGRVGSGMENIDVEHASSRGIHCLNSPEGNRDAVGEHAIGLLLGLLNHIPRADRQVRSGQWIREGNRGTEILGKTVAIIGYGNMGSSFAAKLQGFGARVISYDKYKKDYSDGKTLEVGMDDVFREADILSLHIPLTEETRGLVDDEFINRFRKSFYLLNTARGPVVKTKDLVRNLAAGKVLGAGLDVLEYEDRTFEGIMADPPPEFRELLASDRVILTPHVAGWTVESNTRLASVLVEKIRSII